MSGTVNIPDEAHQAIRKVASNVSKEFYQIVPSDDLYQEFYLWCLEHPLHVDRWWWEGDTGEQMFDFRLFNRDCAGIMAKYARSEKAAQQGYHEDDEQFYSRGQIQDLLPHVWGNVASATAREPEVKTSRDDPARGGDHLISLIDIRLAYHECIEAGSRDDEVMFRVYHMGETHGEVADELGITRQGVSKMVRRLESRIANRVNGTRPRVPSLKDGPGTRKVASNDEARYITARDGGFQ